MPKRTLDSNIVNGIPGKFYGGLRDVIEVEIISVDGEACSTNIRSSDAIRDIFIGALKMDKNEIIGIQVSWKGKPMISFRLKSKINSDKLPRKFSYEKKTKLDDGTEISSEYCCQIKGVRPPRQVDDGIRTVTFEKCGWKLTHQQIIKWASYYGKVLSPVTESKDTDLDPDVRPDDNTVGCGDLKVLVKIRRPIPQFLPMYGYKIRLYYKDIPRMCSNCFQTGHVKKDCENATKTWLHHVVDFISENDQIDEEDFGYWMKKSREYIRDNPECFECPDDLGLDEMNLDSNSNTDSQEPSDDSDSNDVTVTQPKNLTSSPKVNSPSIVVTNPISSVSSVVDSIETKNKQKTKPPPTGEKKPRGRPKSKATSKASDDKDSE